MLNGTTLDIGMLSTCASNGGVYNGDVTLSSQQEVNNFGLFEYVIINGDLKIGDDTLTDITDLTPVSYTHLTLPTTPYV